MTYAACLPIILESEGGFVDNAKDPGGATNHGITLATYRAWMGRPMAVTDLKLIDSQTVAAIYLAGYWNKAGCDACPPGVDLMVFDAAVNSGPTRAVKWLQQAVGVLADGVIGPATRRAIEACDPVATITRLAAIRKTFDDSLPTAAEFGDGWDSRIAHTAILAQQMASQNPAQRKTA